MTDPLDRPSASEALVVRSQRLGRDGTSGASDLELLIMLAEERPHPEGSPEQRRGEESHGGDRGQVQGAPRRVADGGRFPDALAQPHACDGDLESSNLGEVGAERRGLARTCVARRHDDPIPPLDPNAGVMPDLKSKHILWTTEVVQLGADKVTIDAAGTTLNAETAAMKVSYDPGSLTSWTLEVVWFEAGLEQRLNLYFKADESSWWVDEVRVYDDVAPKPDWAKFPPGPHLRSPLGQPFIGNIDIAGQARAGPVRLRIDGAILAVAPHPSFVQPLGGAAPLKADPFDVGGPLHCSGILQLRPGDAEKTLQAFGYRLSWRFEYSTGPNTGYADLRLTAPLDGFISDSAIGPDGELIVFVEDPNRPSRDAASFPPDCPPPSQG